MVSCGAILGKLGTSDNEAPLSLPQEMRELLRGKGLSCVALGHGMVRLQLGPPLPAAGKS